MPPFEKTTRITAADGRLIELKLRIVEEPSNDYVLLEAHLLQDQPVLVGGANILLHPPAPLCTIIPHVFEQSTPGMVLCVSSALIGAAGPYIAACLASAGNKRHLLRQQIEACADKILEQARTQVIAALALL
jgi:hypothetical protein